MSAPKLLVGVGASAGLDALERLFASIPDASTVAFVALLPDAPPNRSIETLRERSRLEIIEATHGQRIEAGKAYVAAFDGVVAVKGRTLSLSGPLSRGPHLPIDHLFRSLALDAGAATVGIVLSGVGADGTHGLREIRAAGGLGIAQAPDTAAQPSLPESAIDAGVVDLILPVEQMGEALARFARTPDADLSWDTAHHRLAAILETHADFALDHYKPATVKRRVVRRMGLAGFDSIEPYFEHLETSAEEQQALVRDLLIGVTDFFRNPDAFAELRTLAIREIVRSTPPGDTVRVWVAGCATGEEAYSIAMLMLEEMESTDLKPELHVFATDVDEEALRTARAGAYPMSIGGQVPEELLRKYFRAVENRRFMVRPQLRDRVSFAVHDLCNDPPFSRMDLVTCRNVLIYLREDTQDRVLRSLHFALKPNRQLLLGTSESIGKHNELFQTLSKPWRIYRKLGPSHPFSPRRSVAISPGVESPRKERRRTPSTLDAARDALLEASPPSIVVSADGRILFSHGELGAFLRFPQGEPRLDLMAAVRPDLTNRVRAALFKCRRDGATISTLSSLDARDLPQTNITVRPAPGLGGGAVVISFEEVVPANEVPPPAESTPESEALIDQLERELTATREDLHSTVEELETSNEELRASHEESMSMNEELQSTNEELEATTEELRSLNEELSTVNSHLKEKVDQLEHAHNDLQNFFASTKLATLFLDEELRIVRFTPSAAKLLRLGQADHGRHITDIARELLQLDLVDDARAVLESLVPSARELKTSEDRWYVRRVLPYRTDSRRIEGVVVNLIDVTDLKEATDRLAVRERQQAVVARLGLRALEQDQIDEFLGQVVNEVKQTLSVDLAWILELQQDAREVVVRAATGWDGSIDEVRTQAAVNSQLAYTLGTSDPVIIDDLRFEKRFSVSPLLHERGFSSGISCQIRDGGQGMLEVHSKQRRTFTTDDANFLQAVANLVGNAIGREKDRRRLAIERGVAQVLAESISFAEAAPRLLEVFARELNLRVCELWTPSSADDTLECSVFLTPGEPYRTDEIRKVFAGKHFRGGESLIGRVWHTGRAEWLTDLSSEFFARKQAAADLNLVAGLAFAIPFGTRHAGVVGLFSRHRMVIDRSFLELFESMGRAVGEFLRRTESFREVAESIPHLVWTARSDGMNEYFNRRALEFFGRSIDDMTRPDAWLDGVHPDDRPEAVRTWREATANDAEYRTDLRLRRAVDGEYLWHEVHALPLHEDDRVLRWIGTCTNVHDRKLMESAQRQAHEQKDQFLAMLGHELRNPLAAIRSASEVLRLTLGTEPRVQRTYAILERQTGHMAKLIDGLLDVSRIVRGKVRLEKRRIDMSLILNNVLSDTSPQIVAADLSVEVDIAASLWVEADPVRIAQIFDNLLGNAIKFSRPAGVIRVFANKSPDPGDRGERGVVRFVDNGVGIEPSLLPHIFEPFQQAHQPLDRSAGGLGLGLALVKGLLELHGGTITAKSEGLGNGAEFELSVPLVLDSGPAVT